MSNRRTVVLVMAKRPKAGQAKTRLSPPLTAQGAADLYEALLDDTIALVSRLPRVRVGVAISPAAALAAWQPRVPPDTLLLPVDGADIGVCLREAMAQAFAAGFEHVLAINSDGPTLPLGYIGEADRALERAHVALGPSDDGGYYLVGLRHPAPTLFTGVAWSTPLVMAQTMERARAAGLTVGLLPSWYDVDTAADLVRLRAELSLLPPAALPNTRRVLADRHGARAPDL